MEAARPVLLVIDDEPTVRHMLRRMLENECYRVREASDGVEGMALFTAHQGEIALVLLDLHLPRMSGYAVLAAIRTIDPQAKVIVITGFPPEYRDRVEGVPVLEKPFSMPHLLQTVAAALGPPACRPLQPPQ